MIDEAMPTMRREMLVIDIFLVSPLWGAIVNPCGQICGKACGDVPINPQPCGQSPSDAVAEPLRTGPANPTRGGDVWSRDLNPVFP